MRKILYILPVLLIVLTASIKAQAVSTADAKNFVNKDTTVTGVATQVSAAKSGIIFINMDGKFPDNKFSAIIYKDDVPKFADVKKMEGKSIAVKGKVQEYNGKYNIILKDPNQLQVVNKKTPAHNESGNEK